MILHLLCDDFLDSWLGLLKHPKYLGAEIS